jgi:hypothetical protein
VQRYHFVPLSTIQVRNRVAVRFIPNRTLILIPVETITMYICLTSLYPLTIQSSITVDGEVEYFICCLYLFGCQLYFLRSKSKCIFDALICSRIVSWKRCLYFVLICNFEAVFVYVWIL